jgi:hypothetical protein
MSGTCTSYACHVVTSVLRKLKAAGIGACAALSLPIPLQGAFQHLGHQRGGFPVAEAAV